jgi:hypothetical protein
MLYIYQMLVHLVSKEPYTLKDAKLNGYNNCLILEDDLLHMMYFNRNIERFFNDVKQWDLCYLLIYFNQK